MQERQLGDYRLIEALDHPPGRAVWLAEQSSIRRSVALVELLDLSQRDSFLADVRAKAAVDHPLIGSVYEAVSNESACYIVLERLPGVTLAERAAARHPLRPTDLAHLLRRVAEAMFHLQSRGIATGPLALSDLHLDTNGVIRIENNAIAGDPDPESSSRDIRHLGSVLRPMVADGQPGTSRVLTLLAWMRGEGIDQQLDWGQVRSYAVQIEAQLNEIPAAAIPGTGPVSTRNSSSAYLIGGLAALALIAALVFFLLPRPTAIAPPASSDLPPPVAISGGDHPSPDGGSVALTPFRIAACEVSIKEYAGFLETLDLLDRSQRGVFDLEGQPAAKTSHAPDDWDAMLAAARSGGTWQGRPMSLHCPVVNLDWWDASAYCEWKRCRLPSQEEWFAAMREKVEKPEFLQPAPWGPVTDIGQGDRTPNGLFGMAGSVSEWTRRPAVNPANPLGPKRHVIIGASFLKPAHGALAREWTDDRLQRRPDLGFRVVFPAE